MTYGQQQLESLWQTAGGAPNSAAMAAAVALAESGGREQVTSSTRDVGLWQINAPTWVGKIPGVPTSSPDQLKDPFTNARAAVAISRGGTDWHPWCTAWSDGACGTRGGSYLGQGAPVLRYIQNPPALPGTPPPAPALPGGVPPAGGLPTVPGAGTGGSTGAGTPQVPGFAGALGNLDSVMNPSTSLWSGLLNPLGTTEKIGLMVIARGGFFVLGMAMISAGVWLAVGRRAADIAEHAAEGGAVGGVGGAAVGAAVGASSHARRVTKSVRKGAARGTATRDRRQKAKDDAELEEDVKYYERTAPTGEAKKAQARRARAAARGEEHDINGPVQPRRKAA